MLQTRFILLPTDVGSDQTHIQIVFKFLFLDHPEYFILFGRHQAHKKNPLGPSLHVTVHLCKLVLDVVIVSLSISLS